MREHAERDIILVYFCPSVRLSVRLYTVTFWYYIWTNAQSLNFSTFTITIKHRKAKSGVV